MSQQIQAVFRNRSIMIAITVLFGGVVLFQEYFPTPTGASVTTKITEVNSLFAAFFTIIGIVQLWRYNLPRIQRRAERWYLSVIVLAIFLVRFVLTAWLGFVYEPVLRFFTALGMAGSVPYVVFQLALTYLIFSRYFGFRSFEFLIFAAGAISYTLYMCTPVSVYAPWLYSITDWMVTKGTIPANYTSSLGLSIGGIVMAILVLLGRETSGYMYRGE